jgi:guanylate kinase
MNRRIFFVIGVSGAGKTALVDATLEAFNDKYDLQRIISRTTRPPRDNEADGIDFQYLSDTQFNAAVYADQFLEWERYGELKHGLPKTALYQAKNLIKEITPGGLTKILNSIDDLKQYIRVISIVTDGKYVIQRLKQRGMSEDDIVKRVDSQLKDEAYKGFNRKPDIYIYNLHDKFEEGKKAMLSYIEGELQQVGSPWAVSDVKVNVLKEMIRMIKVLPGSKLFYGNDGKEYAHVTVTSESDAKKHYYVTVDIEDGGKIIGCTCPNGSLHPYQACKHQRAVIRERLLEG